MPVPSPLVDGDVSFSGVSMNLEPSSVPQGYVALANNVRFDKGKIKTRAGLKCLDWSAIEFYENKPYAKDSKVMFSGKKGSSLNVSAGTVTLGNVANDISDGNFVSQASLSTSTTPWVTQHTPANSGGAWTLDTTNDVAKIAEPSGSLLNLNQEIGSSANTQYGVEINIKSMIPAITIKGDTVGGVTTGYGMSTKVISASSSDQTISGVNSAGYITVEALPVAVPANSVIVWYDTTSITSKFVVSASGAAAGDAKISGVLSVGDLPDGDVGYVEQTLTVETLHTTDGGANAILAGKALYIGKASAAGVVSSTGASIITTDNSASGGSTVKATVHNKKLNVDDAGYGELKIFFGDNGSGSPIGISDGPFPKTISQIITSGEDNQVSKIKIQANEHWAGEIDSVTLTEPAGVVITATTGPASNADLGPVFLRKENDNDEIKPPLHVVNGSLVLDSTNWEQVTGHKIFGLGFDRAGQKTVYGVGSFNDPNGNETVLVATDAGLYGSASGGFFSIPMPTGETFEESVEFVQAFHEVVVFRGTDKRPLILRNMTTGLEAIDQKETDTSIEENESDGTEAIPNAGAGSIFYQNRLIIPTSADTLAVSDFLNVTRFAPISSEFRINVGTSDSLTGLKVADETTGTLLVFKEHSVYRLSNVYGNLESVVMDTISLDYGAINSKCITGIGKDIWFLSNKRGLSSLGLADNAKLTGASVPVSEGLQPIMDSINWESAKDVACAAYNSNRYYLAVPTGTEGVDKILVYSFINGAWEGYDTSPVITGMKGFFELNYGGAKRLFIVDKNGFFHLYDDYKYGGDTDDVPETAVVSGVDTPTGVITKTPITTEVLSRGYIAGRITFKKWRTAKVQTKTQNPTFTVDAEFDGVNESSNLVSGKTYDRTKFDRPFDAGSFTVTDAANFFTPYRQDYTIQAADFATALTNAPATGAIFDPDLMADHECRYSFRGEGKFMQLRVKNTTGRQEITSLSVGALPSETLIYKKQ